MGAITSTVIGVAGTAYAANQSNKAADQQASAGRDAIAANQQALNQSRADLQPFRQAGESALPLLQDRLTNPTTRSDIVNNELFSSLFSNATADIAKNAAAHGKLGSGNTLRDLTNASLSIGSNIYDNRTNQLFNLASMGSNAAAGQATSTLNTAANNANLITGIGNANAAGTVGQANAVTNGINDLTGIARLALLNRNSGNGGQS